MLEEVWKQVVGFEGFYEVSNTGKVKSVDRIITHNNGITRKLKGKVIKHRLTPAGYPRVTLSKEGVWRAYTIHKIVAASFLGEAGGREVNHKDRNKTNNNLDNLEYVSRQRNAEHAIAIDYCFISPDGEVVEGNNLRKLCREFGLNKGNIWLVHAGRQKQHKGWTKCKR